MAFPAGHNPPANFVAGQLKDGSSFGTIDVGSFGGQPVKFKIDLRYYKNKLVALSTVLKADGATVVTPTAIVQRAYLQNIISLALPNDITTLKALMPLVADEGGLSSVGLAPQQLVPVNPTGDLIPFAMNADGKVESFTSPADAAKQAAATQAQTTAAITTLAQGIANNAVPANTGNTPGAAPGPTASTGFLSGMTMTTKIIIGVVVAVVVGGIIYVVMAKPKKGGKKN